MNTRAQFEEVTEEESNLPLYTLGIASQLSGIPAHSIRQYIDTGLIIPYKLKSKRHLFSRNDIERLKLIRGLIRDKGLNFSGVRALMGMIPCWSIRGCSENDRKICGAYSAHYQPCWEASDKGEICRNKDCRECKVYHSLQLEDGIKSVLKTLL
jgi:MerR family transcriptional regulator, heat shock protein HspR